MIGQMGILEGKRREEEGRGGYGGKVAKNTPLPPAMNDGLVVEVISSLVISAPSSSGNFTGSKRGLTLDGKRRGRRREERGTGRRQRRRGDKDEEE